MLKKFGVGIAMLFAFIVGLCFSGAVGRIAPELVTRPAHAATPGQKWEYLAVKGDTTTKPAKVMPRLNLHGSQGWELISARAGMFYFKRPL
jgi:hypothetical protein